MGLYYPTCSKCRKPNDSKSGNWCKQCWRDYHEAHGKERNAKRVRKYAQNPKVEAAKRRAWAKANPEKTLTSQRRDRANRIANPTKHEAFKAYLRGYYRENKEALRVDHHVYYLANKPRYWIHSRNRKDSLKRERRASGWDMTPKWWFKLLDLFAARCCYCGVDGDKTELGRLTPDHIIPISRKELVSWSGKPFRHEPNNIAPACLPCNNSKMDRTPEEWGRVPRFANGNPVPRFVDWSP
jgi:hypothetical protein